MGCVARLCCMTTALAAYVLAQLARHPRRRIRHHFFGRRRMCTARNSCRPAGTRVFHRWPICCWGRLFPRLPSPLESRWPALGFPDSSRQKPIRGSGLATLPSGSLVQATWLTRQRKASSTDRTASGAATARPVTALAQSDSNRVSIPIRDLRTYTSHIIIGDKTRK